MTAPLDFAALWRDTLTAARRDMPLYLSLTAAFVLLPEVAVSLFGPPPPATPDQLSASVIAVQLGVPAVIGAVAQLAIVKLVIEAARGSGMTLGAALRLALIALPTLLVALLLVAVPVVIGLFMLLVPGLYLAARLAMVVPLIIDAHAGPAAAMRRSWAMTEDNGFRILGFIALWTALFFGAGLMVGAVALALDSVLTLAGAKALAPLARVLLSAAAVAVFAVYNAAATATIYLHLTRPRQTRLQLG